jgi:hypothetical protein
LVAYKFLTIEDEIMTAAAPAPKDPDEPSQNTVQTTSSDVIASLYELGVQSAMKSANA